MLLILVLVLALQLCSRSFGGSGTSLCTPLQLSALQVHSKLLLAPTIRHCNEGNAAFRAISSHLTAPPSGQNERKPYGGWGGRWARR
ncbi:hypothetical protein GGI42DRAFT_50318 [Trichoderma sp. SZMC 28013]